MAEITDNEKDKHLTHILTCWEANCPVCGLLAFDVQPILTSVVDTSASSVSRCVIGDLRFVCQCGDPMFATPLNQLGADNENLPIGVER